MVEGEKPGKEVGEDEEGQYDTLEKAQIAFSPESWV